MAINVSVQYNGGFSPIILLTLCHYHQGTLQSMSYLNILAFPPLSGECSRDLDVFRFFFKLGRVLHESSRAAECT